MTNKIQRDHIVREIKIENLEHDHQDLKEINKNLKVAKVEDLEDYMKISSIQKMIIKI